MVRQTTTIKTTFSQEYARLLAGIKPSHDQVSDSSSGLSVVATNRGSYSTVAAAVCQFDRVRANKEENMNQTLSSLKSWALSGCFWSASPWIKHLNFIHQSHFANGWNASMSTISFQMKSPQGFDGMLHLNHDRETRPHPLIAQDWRELQSTCVCLLRSNTTINKPRG